MMKSFGILATIVIVTLFAGSVMAVENYNALNIVKAPTIDGNLSDWSGVP